MFKLSIILNTYNHLTVVKNCLPDMLADCGIDTPEVIINDNGSTDGVEDFIKDYGTKIIYQPDNIGNPQGINQALSHAKGEYIAKVDPDFILPKGWAVDAIELIEQLPRIGMVGFHWARGLKHPDLQKGEIKSVEVVLPTPEGVFKFMPDIKKLIYFIPIKIFGVWVFKREIINEVGCFRDDLSKYGVWDSEFQNRLKRNGYKNIYARHDSVHCGTGHDPQDFRDWKDEQMKQASEKLNSLGDVKYWDESVNFDRAKFRDNTISPAPKETGTEPNEGQE